LVIQLDCPLKLLGGQMLEIIHQGHFLWPIWIPMEEILDRQYLILKLIKLKGSLLERTRLCLKW